MGKCQWSDKEPAFFRLQPTWSDETSLSLLIREFICFLFSHRLIAAVATNSCETSSVPHPPPSSKPPPRHCWAPAYPFVSASQWILSARTQQVRKKATFSLPVTFSIFLHPPPPSLSFSFFPARRPWLCSHLPGLTSIFFFRDVLSGFPLFYFCKFHLPLCSVFTTHRLSALPPPPPSLHTTRHGCKTRLRKEIGRSPQLYFLPIFNLVLLSTRPQTSQRPLHWAPSSPAHCLCCSRSSPPPPKLKPAASFYTWLQKQSKMN